MNHRRRRHCITRRALASVLAVAMALLLAAAPALAQDEETGGAARVLVLPMVNQTEDQRFEDVAGTATDTIALTLELIGDYEVLRPGTEEIDPGDYRDRDVLRELLERHEADASIFGRVTRDDAGGFLLEASVYDRREDRTTITKSQSVGGVLETFAAADRLVQSVVGSFSGVRVGFGRVEVERSGPEGGYRVVIDGRFVGRNVEQVDRVLIGERTVEIRQDRLFGARTIHRETIDVEEGRTTTVGFDVPGLLPEERRRLEDYRRRFLEQYRVKAAQQRVRRLFDEVDAALENLSFNPNLAFLRERVGEQRRRWRLQRQYWRIEEAGVGVTLSDARVSIEAYRRANQSEAAEAVRAEAGRNLELAAGLMALRGEYYLSRGEWQRAADAYRNLRHLAERADAAGYPLARRAEYVLASYEHYTRVSDEERAEKALLRNRFRAPYFSGVERVDEIVREVDGELSLAQRAGDAASASLLILTGWQSRSVRLDGEAVEGNTPLIVAELAEGRHRIRVDAPWAASTEREQHLHRGLNIVSIPPEERGQPRGQLYEIRRAGEESFELSWRPVPEASGYEVQVFREASPEGPPDYRALRRVRNTRKPRAALQFPARRADDLTVRVAPVSSMNNLGAWSRRVPLRPEVFIPVGARSTGGSKEAPEGAGDVASERERKKWRFPIGFGYFTDSFRTFRPYSWAGHTGLYGHLGGGYYLGSLFHIGHPPENPENVDSPAFLWLASLVREPEPGGFHQILGLGYQPAEDSGGPDLLSAEAGVGLARVSLRLTAVFGIGASGTDDVTNDDGTSDDGSGDLGPLEAVGLSFGWLF